MTTRRATIRSSAFLFLALVATRVPACEYGQGQEAVLTLATPAATPDLSEVEAPILANLPTLLV
jgi:hypothetical protein